MSKIIIPQQNQPPKKIFLPVMVIPIDENAINQFLRQYSTNLLGFLPAYVDENTVKRFKTQYLTLQANFVQERKIAVPDQQKTVVDRMKELEEEINKHV